MEGMLVTAAVRGLPPVRQAPRRRSARRASRALRTVPAQKGRCAPEKSRSQGHEDFPGSHDEPGPSVPRSHGPQPFTTPETKALFDALANFLITIKKKKKEHFIMLTKPLLCN